MRRLIGFFSSASTCYNGRWAGGPVARFPARFTWAATSGYARGDAGRTRMLRRSDADFCRCYYFVRWHRRSRKVTFEASANRGLLCRGDDARWPRYRLRR